MRAGGPVRFREKQSFRLGCPRHAAGGAGVHEFQELAERIADAQRQL